MPDLGTSCLGLLLPWWLSAAWLLAQPTYPPPSRVKMLSRAPPTLGCAQTSERDGVPLLLQTVVVIACLRGESICAANGHLYNPISLYCMISTVSLLQGVGEEELGNINRKMASSKRAPFSTYCWLASWFRADKQIWPGSCCSVLQWHQHSRRIGTISRGGRCGCDSCHPLPVALAVGACLSVAKTSGQINCD